MNIVFWVLQFLLGIYFFFTGIIFVIIVRLNIKIPVQIIFIIIVIRNTNIKTGCI
jgi:hypothetical protein